LPEEGLSSADLRQRAQVTTLRRNGNNGSSPIDPIREVLETRKQMTAAALLDQSVTQANTASLQAENDRLKVEIEGQKLLDERNGKSGDGEWREYMFSQLQKTQDQLQETQKALSEQQTKALADRLEMLTGELARLQSERQESPSMVARLREAIDESKALLEVITPVSTPPPSMVADPTLSAWELRARYDQERWTKEREDKLNERLATLQSEATIREAQLQIEREHGERMDRFMSETMPKVVEIGSQILARLLPAGGAAQVAAPAVAASAVPLPSAEGLPAGVEAMTCQACGSRILYRPGYPVVMCANCGAEYTRQPEPGDSQTQEEDGGL